jgi:hypothetical protein
MKKEIDIEEVKKSREERRQEKSKKGLISTIILYVLSAAHLGLLIFYIISPKTFIGFNFIFPVPNVIFASVKSNWLLFFLNLIMLVVGLVFMILRINTLIIK